MAGVCAFMALLLLGSCTSIRIPTKPKKSNLNQEAFTPMSAQDYADQFASMKKSFLGSPGMEVVKTDEPTRRYLEGLCAEIITRNEIFFKTLKKASITILKTESPLHFSLPAGEIFLSRGLISKYIKHESMLVGILSYELVRSEKLLYPKEVVIPTGYLPLERLLKFGRLSLSEKMEVHKWAHHLTMRSGYDGEYYLSWLQTQNRNTADFVLQVGDINQINQEEAMFKSFLIKNSTEDDSVSKKNSSKQFYTLINKLRDGVL